MVSSDFQYAGVFSINLNVASLKDTGRAAVVMDTGAVTRGSGSKNEDRERNIRKWFVENDYVDGVILLPDNLFYNTTAAGIIVVLRKNKPKDRKGKITLVNASREFKKGSPKNYLTDEALKKIADAFHKGEAVKDFCAVISNEQAAESDFNLAPSRYLATNTEEIYRPIAELLVELDNLDAESERVYGGLRALLNKIGI